MFAADADLEGGVGGPAPFDGGGDQFADAQIAAAGDSDLGEGHAGSGGAPVQLGTVGGPGRDEIAALVFAEEGLQRMAPGGLDDRRPGSGRHCHLGEGDGQAAVREVVGRRDQPVANQSADEAADPAFVIEVLEELKATDDARDYAEELKLLHALWTETLEPWDERGYLTRPRRLAK